MKAITTTTSLPKADSCFDATLNPVALRSGKVVSWGVAFPRPGTGRARAPDQKAATLAAGHPPVWRTDATTGSVLGALGPSRMTA